MPLWQRGRPLKRWRYIGIYGPEVMVCAARVTIGGLPQAFWAVWDRGSQELHERTVFAPGSVRVRDGVRFAGDGVSAELEIVPGGEPIEVVSAHGRAHIWTRKQPARATGTVTVGDRVHRIDEAALIDDSAGYHARETAWTWCAGVGTGAGGEALCWNLVDGVHDAPVASERSVWTDGVAAEVEPVEFDGLDAVRFASGELLRFHPEAQRSRDDRVGPITSSYHQPFGTFAGRLPGGLEVVQGYGVMERHDVRW